MAGTKPITHPLRNQEESRCIVWGGATEKQSRLVRGAHTIIASQQYTLEQRAHTIKHHMSGSEPITHQLQEGSKSMYGVGRQKYKAG